ncbi:D-glycero-alpha-D-manno-heptose-1,7-bisphosphate 7-phosphatase [Bacteroidota bacterium]
MKRKAVFLDRDGTIIKDVGNLKSSENIVFYGNVYTALKNLQKEYLLFVITNQPRIEQGLLSMKEVKIVNQAIVERFKAESIDIKKIFICPHKVEDNCWCRKPEPYFLYKAAKEYNLDLSKSFMIGDHPADVYCAENAGVNGIYVLTGHGIKHLHELKNKPIMAENILQAANMIINKLKN